MLAEIWDGTEMPRVCLAAICALITAHSTISSANAQSSDGDVDNRLLRLEEQIVDLSAQVGTLETIAKNGISQTPQAPAADPSAVVAGSDSDRIVLMETQLRALSSQISDLVNRINQLEGGTGGASQNSGDSAFQQGEPGNADDSDVIIIDRDSSGKRLNGGNGSFDQSLSDTGSAPVQTAAQSSPQAQAMYDEAYNALVQRNYRAAADNFRQFVAQYETDPLAGQAYFWLGEAAFVNGQYREAADSFLKSSTNYPQNQKAPESLLKLGISLKRLGETEAACSSFSEVERRFPEATQVLERTEREQQRTKCPQL